MSDPARFLPIVYDPTITQWQECSGLKAADTKYAKVNGQTRLCNVVRVVPLCGRAHSQEAQEGTLGGPDSHETAKAHTATSSETFAYDWSPLSVNRNNTLLTVGLRFNEPLPVNFHNTMSLGYVRNSLGSEISFARHASVEERAGRCTNAPSAARDPVLRERGRGRAARGYFRI